MNGKDSNIGYQDEVERSGMRGDKADEPIGPLVLRGEDHC